MAVNADEILKKLHDVMEKMQDQNESLQEKIDKVEEDAHSYYNEMKAWRAEHVSPHAPLDDTHAMAVNQRGGIFGGKFKLPYKKMLSMPTEGSPLSPVEKERLKTIQNLHDACVLRWYALSKRPGVNMWEEMQKSVDFQLYGDHLVSAGYAKAANDLLNPAGGTGANLDFTLLSAQLIDEVRIAAILPAQFRTFPMQRKVQEFPAFRTGVKAIHGGASSINLPQDDTAGAPWTGSAPPSGAILKPTFGQIQFDAEHCLGFIMYTDDMLEDSIVPLLPILREQAVSMINDAREDGIVNGDTTATHMDSDTSEPAFATAVDGLRKMGENNQFDAGAAQPIAALDGNKLMQKLGKWARRQEELIWIMNVQEWLRLAADADLRTANTYGIDRATLRQGVTNQVWGMDIVLSPEVRRNLNESGVHDGVTENEAVTIVCNRTRFWLGEKNQLDVELVRVPAALGNWIQADLRTDFQALDKEKADQTFTSTFVTNNGGAPVAVQIDVSTA